MPTFKLRTSSSFFIKIIFFVSLLVFLSACKTNPINPNRVEKSLDNVTVTFEHCRRDGSSVSCYFHVKPIDKAKHFFVHYQTSSVDNEGNQYCIAQIGIGSVTEKNDARCEDHSSAGLIKLNTLTNIKVVFDDVSASANVFTSIDLRAFAGRNRQVRVLSYANVQLGGAR